MTEPSLAIEQLNKLILEGGTPDVEADSSIHTRWRANAESVLRKVLPPDSPLIARFITLQYYGRYTANRVQSALDFQETTRKAVALLEAAIFELELQAKPESTQPSAPVLAVPNVEEPLDVNRKLVFVVHGRNSQARNAMFDFLRSVGLHPLEWDEAVSMTGVGSPYIGDVLDVAFKHARAIVVLLTPDEIAYLQKDYANGEDDPELKPGPQARPNVLFEAGLAMGRNANGTVLVELGEMRGFSDVEGRHAIRLTNDIRIRTSLVQRLETAGCEVDLSTEDWKSAGDFQTPRPGGGLPLGRRIPEATIPGGIQLDAKYHPRGRSNGDLLEIINKGREDVFGLDLNVPPEASILVVKNDLPLERLPAGKSFKLLATRTMQGTKRQFELTIIGKSLDGESFTENVFLDTIG